MMLDNLKRNNIRDLIISVLPYVSKPSRYIGGEINSVKKRFEDVKVKIALAFPDTYEIGMSYFGFQILYNILNREKDILAERVYAPWVDMIEIMEKYRIPLFSLESKTPVKNFDIIGFTLQYELHYTTILKMLELSDLKVRRSERGLSDPIIIGGGPCAFNPELMAEFIDVFLIGDGEEVLKSIAEFVGEKKLNNFSKREILKELTNFKGVYVPEFYNRIHDNKGNFKILPSEDNIPAEIEAITVKDLKREYLPKKPILPSMKIIQDGGTIEIMRGCTRGCRFCSAGYVYRPSREREINDVIKYAFDITKRCGYEEVSLLSLSASDYTHLKDFMVIMMDKISEFNVSFSFPSLRADSFTEEMAEFAKNVRKSGLTLAVEAATERLRRVINKKIDEEGLINSVITAFKNGWMLIKLYFMIGLPTEIDEDVIEIGNLAEKIIKLGKPYGRVSINLSVSPFVPKPFTPFQW
ncbi:MAG: TIGR03960 family B12-binding radical SAM protein, partial [Candidatus Helarchaeota archaeon]|nr:TIGR03960 family B12-binding radical SAM protein [Candidatus Helarchaeota archaeon]